MTSKSDLLREAQVSRMVEDMIATQNICSIMEKDLLKEFEAISDRVIEKYGEGIGQKAAILMAAETFLLHTLSKFSLTLSLTELPFEGSTEESAKLMVESASQFAQILQEGFNHEAEKHLERVFNIKNEGFLDEIKFALGKVTSDASRSN